MTDKTKTWMIEPGDVLDVLPPSGKPLATATVKTTPAPERRPVVGTAPPEPLKRRPKVAPPPKSKLQFAHLAVLTYLLGPLAILLTPRGRARKNTLIMAGIAVMATAALVLSGFGGLVRVEHATSVWAWAALLTIAVTSGFTVWARAVHLLAREGLPPVNRLPYWLRRRWSVSLLGLVAPGSGLLLGGRTGRAALVLWLSGAVVAAGIVLANAQGLWQHHQHSGWLSNSGPALEVIFIVAACTVALGFLGYVAQALEGARQIIVEPGLRKSVRGDYYAVAVLALVVTLVLVVSPVQLANQLDIGGDILQAEGLQVIPLQLTLAAQRLDPGQPAYALQAAELYTALGETEKAAAVRAELDRDLGSYLAMVRRETGADYVLTRADERAAASQRPVRARPHVAAETSVPTAARDKASRSELDPGLLVGTLVRDHGPTEVAEPDTTPTPTAAVAGASQTMGMPYGLDSSANDSLSRPSGAEPHK